MICKDRFDAFFPLDFIKDKVEEALGVDLNHDGRIGGPGPLAQVERATHVDLNRDGIIGGHRPSPSGGLVGKIESATHIDLNHDGRIGGALPGYRPH